MQLLFAIFLCLQTILCGLVIGRSIALPIANVWLSPIPALSPLRQYHIQDGSGSYQYSFTGPHHAKAESTLNGVTQGGEFFFLILHIDHVLIKEPIDKDNHAELRHKATDGNACHDS